MWLRQLRVRAFGPLRGEELELGPGLNVVHGPNESAKSSWHAALTAGLCGRRRGSGRRTAETAFEARHRPWDDPDNWALALDLTLDDGREIEIDRDFAAQRTTVIDTGLGGRPVDDDIIRDGAPDGAAWLGLDRETFPITASVRQAEMLAVAGHGEGLRDHLARAASGGNGVTAAAALERLRGFQKQHVGVEKVSAVKPLRRAMNEVEDATAELQAIRERHTQFEQVVAAAEAARAAVRRTETELASAEAALATSVADEWSATLQRLETLALEFPHGEPAAGLERPTARVATVVERHRSVGTAPETDLPPVAELEAALGELPSMPHGPFDVPTEVAEAVLAYRAAVESAAADLVDDAVIEPSHVDVDPAHVEQWVRPLRASPLPSLDEAREQLEQALALQRTGARAQQRARRASLGGWAAMVASALIAMVGGGPGQMAAVVLAAFAVAVIVIAARTPRAVEAPEVARHADRLRELEAQHAMRDEEISASVDALVGAGLPTDPDQAVAAAIAGHLARDKAHAAQARRAAAQAAIESRRASALEHLSDHGVVNEDPLVGLAELRAACGHARATKERIAAGAVLRQQLEQRHAHDRVAAAHEQERLAVEEELYALAAAHGLDGPTPGDVCRQLEELLRTWEQRAEHDRAELRRWERLQHALDGRSLDEIRAEGARLRDVADAAATASGGAVASGDDPRVLVARAERALADATQRSQRAEGALSQVDADTVDVAAGEARLTAARGRLESIRRLRDTLDTTAEFLQSAHEQAHRVIAPQLEKEMSKWVPVVTAGRYTHALVDPESLAIRLRDQDGFVRDASLVSHGTAEQVHLVLRMVLAQLLSTGADRCPVLLDDPTVHCDAGRTVEVLEYLRELSRSHQVIVFSQELDVAQWASERLDPDIDRFVQLDPAEGGATPAIAEPVQQWLSLRSVR